MPSCTAVPKLSISPSRQSRKSIIVYRKDFEKQFWLLSAFLKQNAKRTYRASAVHYICSKINNYKAWKLCLLFIKLTRPWSSSKISFNSHAADLFWDFDTLFWFFLFLLYLIFFLQILLLAKGFDSSKSSYKICLLCPL